MTVVVVVIAISGQGGSERWRDFQPSRLDADPSVNLCTTSRSSIYPYFTATIATVGTRYTLARIDTPKPTYQRLVR